MLSNYTLSNFNKIKHLHPSLLFSVFKNDDDVNLDLVMYLNVDSTTTEYGDQYAVLGSMSVMMIDEHSLMKDQVKNQFFVVNGTSSAYPGFGKLLYQMMMIKIDEISGGCGYLVCDRESIRYDAEMIYQKMNKDPNFQNVAIPLNNPTYSKTIESDVWFDIYHQELGDIEYNEFLDLVKSGKVEPTYLNKGYKTESSKEIRKIYDEMISNNENENPSVAQQVEINETAMGFAEFCMDDLCSDKKKSLIKDLENGIPRLIAR